MPDPSITSQTTFSANDVAIMQLKASVDELTKEVRELRYIVVGNGNPTDSLVYKVDSLIASWDNLDTWQSHKDKMDFRAWLWRISNSAVSIINLTWLIVLTMMLVTHVSER